MLAVYNGVPLIGTFIAVAAASETVHGMIREKLVEAGTATADELTEDVLEDIKVRACLVRATVGEVKHEHSSCTGLTNYGSIGNPLAALASVEPVYDFSIHPGTE